MNLKKIVKYTFLVCLSSCLLYYTYRDISLHEFLAISREVKLGWIFLAIVAHLVNHALRAFRWRLFVEVQGYKISYRDIFLSEMSGFCMNLIPPRMGEWVRCVLLKRLSGVPISKSLAGVVVERFIDIVLLLLLFCATLVINFFNTSYTLRRLKEQLNMLSTILPSSSIFYKITLFVVLLLFVIYVLHSLTSAKLWQRIKHFFKEVLFSISKIRKSNISLVFGLSFSVLFFHFMVEYISFYAVEEIKISWQNVLVIFISMHVGMSAPTPGGIGVYHFVVITTLETMGVAHNYAVLYATITHGIQLLNATLVGGICTLIATFIPVKNPLKGSNKSDG